MQQNTTISRHFPRQWIMRGSQMVHNFSPPASPPVHERFTTLSPPVHRRMAPPPSSHRIKYIIRGNHRHPIPTYPETLEPSPDNQPCNPKKNTYPLRGGLCPPSPPKTPPVRTRRTKRRTGGGNLTRTGGEPLHPATRPSLSPPRFFRQCRVDDTTRTATTLPIR